MDNVSLGSSSFRHVACKRAISDKKVKWKLTKMNAISIPESSGFFTAVGRLKSLWDNGMKVR